MSKKKKTFDSKVTVTIVLLVVLIVAAVALVYAVEIAPSSSGKSGLQVGDTFFYNITGTSKIFNSSAISTPSYLYAYNGTEYYEVNITGVSGHVITFNTVWQFKNGTTIQSSEYINLETGANSGAFWAIYLPNLNKNNLLNPVGNNGLIVNSTSTETFPDSTRTINTWTTDNILYDSTDPTRSSQQDNFLSVDFDKQTGMLIDLTNLQQYNNPQYDILVIWQLTNSTVWTV